MRTGRKVYDPLEKDAPEGSSRRLAKGGSYQVNKYTDTKNTYQYKYFQEHGHMDPTVPIPRTREVDTNMGYKEPRKVDFNKTIGGIPPKIDNRGAVPSYNGRPRIENSDLQKAAMRKLKTGSNNRMRAQ